MRIFRRRRRIFVRKRASKVWVVKALIIGLIVVAVFLYVPVLDGATTILSTFETILSMIDA